MRFDTLQDKVVVITGASSGIGKLAAEQFLQEGAKVVMAARSEDEMRQHIRQLGVDEARALVVSTDVSNFDAVQFLAHRANEHFGHIDIWVNNAAVNLYGMTDELSIQDIRRVIDVNLMGYIHGMKAALDVFKYQGYGNIINIDSVDGVMGLPLQSAYSASKHGIIGFACALREELMSSRFKDMDIEVSDILPASMDTPLFTHAKSVTGRQPKPMPPVYDPVLTVDKIIECAKRPKPMVIVGGSGKMMAMEARFMPTLMEKFFSKVGIPAQQSRREKSREEQNNLYQPMSQTNKVRGGYSTPMTGVLSQVERHPMRSAAIAVGVVWLARNLLGARRGALA
jgi:NAD(P)-dependent dehydrogenase (short-subunit alcohol dehydrogenase family)